MQYLTFRLNGVEYAIDVRIVETIVEDGATTAVPTPIEYMLGVMDLRGQVIPVIDLRRKFGLPATEGRVGANIIVFAVADAAGANATIGALVDEVSEVVNIEDADIGAGRIEGIALWEGYVRGIVRLEGRMVVVVAADSLFSLREIEAMHTAA